MNARAGFLPPPGSSLANESICDVTIVYEDLATGNHALELLQSLVAQYGERCRFRPTWWKLGALTNGSPRDRVDAKSSRADLLIFSLRGSTPVSGDLNSWFEVWRQQRGARPGALIALIDPDTEPDHGVSLCARLQELARRGSLAFLAGGAWRTLSQAHGMSAEVASEVRRTESRLGDLLNSVEPYHRGGLNE